MLTASAGTLTGQTTSLAAPAASTTSCGGRAIGTRVSVGAAHPGSAGRALQRRPHLHLARRRVAQGQHGAELVAVAHQRRQAGEHLQVLGDADAGAAGAELLHPASATATSLKLVSESLIGTATVASPLASTTMFAFQISRVSNSSRAAPRPPPPPAATAFLP